MPTVVQEEVDRNESEEENDDHRLMEIDAVPQTQIVLHEDKKYYPTAEEVFGEDVEALVQEEDTQLLSEPIIAPKKVNKTFIHEEHLPETCYSKEYLMDLMAFPSLVRNIALVGHLHHGKTGFIDMLVSQTHLLDWSDTKAHKYTDVHELERTRGLSIKSMPTSLVLPNLRGKSHMLNILDTPGHVNFTDEVTAAVRVSDGAVVVVDVVEGVMVNTERIIKNLVFEDIPFVLVLNKIDRLILELKLPPMDAYYKLKFTVEEVNSLLVGLTDFRVGPELGNVCFAATEMGWSFTLESFAKMYAENSPEAFDSAEFAKRLWGDVYFDTAKRTFRRNKSGDAPTRSFVYFILEPLYKLVTHVIGEDQETLRVTLESLGIHLKPSMLSMDVRPLLRIVCKEFLGTANGFVEMCVTHLPSPLDSAHKKLQRTYTGPLDSKYAAGIQTCDPEGPLMIQIVKLYNADDVTSFDAFGRVLSGTVKSGQNVRVLGEAYSPDDDEDMSVQEVVGLSIFESR